MRRDVYSLKFVLFVAVFVSMSSTLHVVLLIEERRRPVGVDRKSVV